MKGNLDWPRCAIGLDVAIAAHHVANGERLISRSWQKAHSDFVEAAKIYDSIGKHEKAATCFIKSRDFEKAGWSCCCNITL